MAHCQPIERLFGRISSDMDTLSHCFNQLIGTSWSLMNGMSTISYCSVFKKIRQYAMLTTRRAPIFDKSANSRVPKFRSLALPKAGQSQKRFVIVFFSRSSSLKHLQGALDSPRACIISLRLLLFFKKSLYHSVQNSEKKHFSSQRNSR